MGIAKEEGISAKENIKFGEKHPGEKFYLLNKLNKTVSQAGAESTAEPPTGKGEEEGEDLLGDRDTSVVPFGFFYVGPQVCTLGWQGALAFSLLDVAALGELDRIITARDGSLGQGSNVRVILVRQAKGLLEEFDFRQNQYFDYRSADAETGQTRRFSYNERSPGHIRLPSNRSKHISDIVTAHQFLGS